MDYEKKYKEALVIMEQVSKDLTKDSWVQPKIMEAFPELKESEGEKTKRLLHTIANKMGQHLRDIFTEEEYQCFDAWSNAWLEKQGEQKPTMIQWKGDNLKEVIDFTGVYKEGFEKWFHNSWEEYEKYVHRHNNIFKIFNEDGSHIEVPVGAWIVKTPDGYNTASRYVFRQKPTEWSEEDEYCRHQLIVFCENCMQPDSGAIRCANWLKSLKDRVQSQSTWKPSDEHYELEEFAKIVR